MIKRWTIHFEYHWGYWPRFSIRRNPRHGDRVVDGGVPGTLKRCPTCQDGFLHEPDLIMTGVTETDLGLKIDLRCSDAVVEKFMEDVRRMASFIDRPGGSNHKSNLAMDLNAPMPSDIVEAPRTSTMAWHSPMPDDIPKVKVTMVPGPQGNLTELLLGKGSLTYVVGETVWFNHSEHVVELFEPEKRVVLRHLPFH